MEHIAGTTFHGRQSEGVANSFRYGVDYVLIDAQADLKPPLPLRRNARGLMSLWDSDHGGPPKQGRGVAWVKDILNALDLPFRLGRIDLLAQPRVLGHVFNPVSFWLIHDGADSLRVVIPEVTNTFGDRHSYLVHADGFAPITREMTLEARKTLHVSPFQPQTGGYSFRFDISDQKIGIWIDYRPGNGRLLATLTGKRQPLTTRSLLGAMLRRPFGARRVLALIHWQALKLWWKRAPFRPRPAPPTTEISR
jgi:DUF1365 family protein